MRSKILILGSLCGLLGIDAALGQSGNVVHREEVTGGIHWPAFRGANASGIAEGYPTPTSWNVEEGRNVLWKTTIPGLGHSAPVIWDDLVFLTSAISSKGEHSLRVGVYGDIASVVDSSMQRWVLYCLDKKTGKILWEETAHSGVPGIKRHAKLTHANSTPATNGKFVVTFFGSEGLYCYDLQGTLIWKKDFGILDSGYFVSPGAQWGFGSSPIIYEGRVIVQCDVQGGDFVAVFNLEDGKELWRTSRDEVPTWSTPTIYETENMTQIIVNGYHQIGGYDLQTGRSIWQMKGGGDIPVPTPIVGHDLVFITNHHGGSTPIYAVRLNERIAGGANSGFEIAWSKEKDGAYLQTPIVYGDYFYCSRYGILRCFKANTGDLVYKVRLSGGSAPAGFTPSPVAANGMIYFTSEMGVVHVVAAGPEFKIVEKNELGAPSMATPAISEGILFFRTQDYLVAISD